MPSHTMLNIKIKRESNNVPWGFRMQGGRDFGSAVQIQYVNPNSLSEQCGMRTNDYILRIGDISTENLLHKEAQEYIKRQNNLLELILQRGSPPTSADYNNYGNFSPQSPPPPQSPGLQVVMPLPNNRVMLSQTYNTPVGLYSADNISDTIARTLTSANISPDYNIQQPKNSSEFKAPPVKSMPKPAPFNYPQQPRPEPVIPLSKPTPTNKPLFNANKPGASSSGNRKFQKGNKGSALLNRNDNTNQRAVCFACGINIRGPFISAIGHCYCVDHFTCSNCSINLVDCGFVEENGKLYCEHDFEQYLAPHCAKCSQKILKECVHALEKTWHPECFVCAACKKSLGLGTFHVEEGQPYCAEDYRRMFQSKCTSCEFPIEPGDKYLEAMGGTYHAECFTCSTCQVSLDGQAFVVKNDRPYCRQHGGRQMNSLFN